MEFLKAQVFVTNLKRKKHEEKFLEILVTRFTESCRRLYVNPEHEAF